MRVLVTGSNGQVGHCLVERLTNKVELLAVDRQDLDITNRDLVVNVVQEFRPDFIINAAAHTAVDKAEQEVELAFAVNRDGPQFLAEAANTIGATILHISTDYVFSGDKDGLYLESDSTSPLGVYGESKLAGEQALLATNEKSIVLRTAWVFGEHGGNFVKTMLRLGKEREALNIVGDQFGGPTYAGDIADALISIVNQLHQQPGINKYGVYHFSGYPHVSWYEFAQSIFACAEENQLFSSPKLTSIPTEMYPTPAARPANSKMSCEKISCDFDIDPSDWVSALKNIKAYLG